jgi:HPt (histidine-containing phosphotransfer) domain-containing protein
MAARHAHAIAGSAGNFGADALRAAAAALEHAGRNGRIDLAKLLAAVDEQAAIVFRSIETLRRAPLRPASTEVAGTSAVPFDRAAAGRALDRLAIALESYDLSSATDALTDLDAAGLGAWAPDDAQQLRRYVDDYAYDEAKAVVTRMAARVHEGKT